MPRATKSTAKQPARGQARAATSRKATTKAAAKTTTRGTKTTTTRRTAAATKTAKTKRTASAPPPKTAARSRGTTKAVKATKTPARPAKAPAKTLAKTPAKTVAKAPSKPVKKALKPQDKQFLAEQRELLLAERTTYTQQAESLKAEADQLAEDMEPGDIQFDEESGEGGTMNVERERDLALSAQASAAVEEIDKALAKIADGTYGYCEQCGQPIPKARLKALPYAALCVACKSGGLSRR